MTDLRQTPRTTPRPISANSYQPVARVNQRSLGQIISAWPTSPRTTWSETRLRSALQAHQMGDFGPASQLWDAIREDDEIPGALETRVAATLGADFAFRLQDPTATDIPARARVLQDAWDEIAPQSALEDVLSDLLMLGVAVATLDWDTTTSATEWRPTLRALPAEFLRYDDARQIWTYQARSAPDGSASALVDVTPGDGKWVLLCQGTRPWMKGYLRRVASLWRGKQLTLGDWARYCQKHGLPLLKAMMPIFRDQDEKDGFIDDLEALGTEGIIGLPQDEQGNGYDVELLEATTVSWQTFQASLERADRKVQVMLLGGNAPTETVGSTGSRNTAEVQSKGLIGKARRDAAMLARGLRWQLVRPYAIVNWGDGMATARGEIPRPVWDVAPEADVQAWENSRLQFANMLKTLGEAGYSVTNLPQVARDLGLELQAGPPKGSAADVAKTQAEKPPEPAPKAPAGGGGGA